MAWRHLGRGLKCDGDVQDVPTSITMVVVVDVVDVESRLCAEVEAGNRDKFHFAMPAECPLHSTIP